MEAKATNDPFAGMNMDEIIASFSMKRMVIKCAIALAYGFIGGLVLDYGASMLTLLVTPPIAQFIVLVLFISIGLAALWMSSIYVTEFVYSTGAKFFAKVDEAKQAYADAPTVKELWTRFKLRVVK